MFFTIVFSLLFFCVIALIARKEEESENEGLLTFINFIGMAFAAWIVF